MIISRVSLITFVVDWGNIGLFTFHEKGTVLFLNDCLNKYVNRWATSEASTLSGPGDLFIS